MAHRRHQSGCASVVEVVDRRQTWIFDGAVCASEQQWGLRVRKDSCSPERWVYWGWISTFGCSVGIVDGLSLAAAEIARARLR